MSAIDNSYKMDGDVSLVILFLFLSLFLSQRNARKYSR